jgi:hypothetical protein
MRFVDTQLCSTGTIENSPPALAAGPPGEYKLSPAGTAENTGSGTVLFKN